MKHTLNLFFIFFFLTIPQILHPKAAITYDWSGGRFGDNILAYLHAKWLSIQYPELKFYYRPFKYSDQLVLHQKEQQLNKEYFDENKKESEVNNLLVQNEEPRLIKKTLTKKNLIIDPDSNYLYVVPYFSEFDFEHKLYWWNAHWIRFEIDWKDPIFYQEMRKMVRPINEELLKVEIPNGFISVAVHVRKGGGFDIEGYFREPLKFVHGYFYIDQIKKLSELFNHAGLYVYIFTDDKNPEDIIDWFKRHLRNYGNIWLDCRSKDNYHDSNVVEDFFAMTQFDCFIHSLSTYSFLISKLGNFKVEIFPTDWTFKEQIIVNV